MGSDLFVKHVQIWENIRALHMYTHIDILFGTYNIYLHLNIPFTLSTSGICLLSIIVCQFTS